MSAHRDRPAGRPHRIRHALLLALLGGAGGAAVAGRRRPPEPPPQQARLPGRPRLVGVLGGSAPHAAAGPAAPETLLREGVTVLGRAKDCDIHLADLTVSPRHATVEASRTGRVVVRDLGALNGLRVDGVPVVQARVHDGQRLSLGHAELVVRIDPVSDDGGREGGELGERAAR